MPLSAKALGATLSLSAVAAAILVAPALAQQAPLETGPPPAAQAPAGPPQGAPPPGGPPPSAQPPSAPPAQAAPVRRGPPRYALAIANVNLRAGPGTDAQILATIPGGSNVAVTSCSGEWCAVMWNGQSGYAIARNLDTGGPTGPSSPPPAYAAGPVYAEPPVVYYGPRYYPPPYGYYGPGVYFGWGWRRW
jgi:uncharacterized protein YgiM (DUF1202 family)